MRWHQTELGPPHTAQDSPSCQMALREWAPPCLEPPHLPERLRQQQQLLWDTTSLLQGILEILSLCTRPAACGSRWHTGVLSATWRTEAFKLLVYCRHGNKQVSIWTRRAQHHYRKRNKEPAENRAGQHSGGLPCLNILGHLCREQVLKANYWNA